jgi:hypothetical protein
MPYENIGLALQVVMALLGAFFLAFWLSLIIWTFRDVRSRSRDVFAQLLATLMVILFNLPGLVLYFMLRPQETLAQAYERALEEEALLQDIEERYVCPGCKKKIQPDYQLCPSCHARLKRPCPSCNRLLQLQWTLCPYCGAVPAGPGQPAVGSKPRSAAPSVTQPIQVHAETKTSPLRKLGRPEIPIPVSYQVQADDGHLEDDFVGKTPVDEKATAPDKETQSPEDKDNLSAPL